MSKPWTTLELRYLEEHSDEGADEVARRLGRSVPAIRAKAREYGISMTRRWYCPRCGRWTYKVLSPRTGWCAACTKERRRWEIEAEIREMKEEQQRIDEENRRLQALYSMKNWIKTKEGGNDDLD